MSNAQFWRDRISEYPSRRKITNLNTGEVMQVQIERDEGSVTEEGTAFSAENMNKIVEMIYPVGAIYMSVNNVSPQTLFGGTWEQIQDKFLLSAGTTYTAGDTGGSAAHSHTTGDHTLTVDEIPSHNHKLSQDVEYKFSSEVGGWTTFRAGTDNVYPNEVWTQNAGGGQAHNHGDTETSSNMPPYLAVYVWKRIS